MSGLNDNSWIKLGKQILDGYKIDEIELNGRLFKFSPKQTEFISNFKNRFCLYSGGFGCGKSLGLYAKLILHIQCFPGNRILVGRKTLADIERGILPDLFNLMPSSWYTHKVKEAVINFKNGSQVILFGLDALQQGGIADIKKAEQKVKSLNLGAYFIDQLEEIEYSVFEALNSRLRNNVPLVRQGNMTTNPANFWGYHYFKDGKINVDGEWVEPPKPSGAWLIEGSMLDNKEYLPPDYLEDRLSRDERYVKRYVYGEWSTDILTDKAVFAKEHIQRLEEDVKPPIKTEEGCQIWEQPSIGNQTYLTYRMGIDPSEGVVDPSSITVISDTGKKVAKYNGKIPIPVLKDKVFFLYQKYREPLIIPEVNSMGIALLEQIKDLNVYKRKVMDYKYNKETEKLGFKTSHQSKAALITHFQDLLRKKVPKIYDRQTIEEIKAFEWSDSAKRQGAGAPSGFHDDDVMSTLLAFWEFSPEKIEYIRAKQSIPHAKRTFQYR